jgi:hypothetical protein
MRYFRRMKQAGMLVLLISVMALRVVAGEPSTDRSGDTVTTSAAANFGFDLSIQPRPLDSQPLIISPQPSPEKKSKLSAALARPFKALQPKRLLGLPGRLLKPLNPFAPIEPNELQTLNPSPSYSRTWTSLNGGFTRPSASTSRQYDPRAWTTIAGWSPGASAFPDPITSWP